MTNSSLGFLVVVSRSLQPGENLGYLAPEPLAHRIIMDALMPDLHHFDWTQVEGDIKHVNFMDPLIQQRKSLRNR